MTKEKLEQVRAVLGHVRDIGTSGLDAYRSNVETSVEEDVLMLAFALECHAASLKAIVESP